jgi:hypothetical protein
MKMPHSLVIGPLALLVIAGCQFYAPVVPTSDGMAATPPSAEAQPAAPAQPEAPVTTPVQSATLSGKATIFGTPVARATVQVLPLGGVAASGSSKFQVMAANKPVATGQTNDDGTYTVQLPDAVPEGTPLKVLVIKNGQALATAFLSGQAQADVPVTQSTTLAFLTSRLDQIGRALFTEAGQLASPKAAEDMIHAFKSLADATEKGIQNSGEGAEVVAEALKSAYAAEGKEITPSLEKAFSRAAKDVADAFQEAANQLNDALKTAKTNGGQIVTTHVSIGNNVVSVTNSSGGSSSSNPTVEQPTIQVEATGTFQLPRDINASVCTGKCLPPK